MRKKWKLAEKAPDEFFAQNKNKQISKIALQLLYNRGIKTQEQIEDFLSADYEKDMHDPYLFNDMKKAVKIVVQAILNKNKIVVHGDYDADGITASAIIYEVLKIFGADVEVFLPHREKDGYGMNLNTIEKFKEENIDLIITVDCGISNADEIEKAKKYGIKTIVTDHHVAPPKIPDAEAIIDPKVEKEKYPDKNLAGAGVSYKLACALLDYQEKTGKLTADQEKLKLFGNYDGLKKWLLDLVAIGTVADIVPLLGENRVLVKYGLIVLKKTQRPGLIELMNIIGLDKNKINTQTIGFMIGPRLNAAGRLKHANIAFDLLAAEDGAQALHLASLLQNINFERQQITESIVNEAKAQIENQKESKIYFVYDQKWTAGVIGLVAGKLSDELNLPTMAMTKVGENIVGSGRSIVQYHITEALYQVEKCLLRFGGHAQACGFTISAENHLKFFQKTLASHAQNLLDGVDTDPVIDVDAKLDLDQADEILCKNIELLEPFGEGNNKPRFLIKGAEVVNFKTVGQDGKHLRIFVKGKKQVVKKMIGFGLGSKYVDKINIEDKIDAIVEISDSQWNGEFDLQIKIIDMKLKSDKTVEE